MIKTVATTTTEPFQLSICEPCPRCKGTRRIPDEFGELALPCPRCHGKGELPSRDVMAYLSDRTS